MGLIQRQDSIDIIGREGRGIVHHRHVPTAAAIIDPVASWPAYRLYRGNAMQIDYRFWLAASATDKLQTVQLWGYPADGDIKPRDLQSGPNTYYTGVADLLATLTFKFGGKTCANKNPITGIAEGTMTWHQASFVSADTFRINTDAIKFLRNVDDDNVLVIRTERLIYGSFLWHGSEDIDAAATEFMTEAFFIQ